jgi:hypothetical protein
MLLISKKRADADEDDGPPKRVNLSLLSISSRWTDEATNERCFQVPVPVTSR